MYLDENRMPADFAVQMYRPGDRVPKSGIYKVSHLGHHHDHEVTCVSGEQFPRCHQCGEQVRFSLLIAAHAIGRHMHFFSGRDAMMNSAR